MSKDALKSELEKLTKELKLQNSAKRRFFLGIVSGVGSALGATIVASLVIILLSQVIKTVDDLPILNSFMMTSSVDTVIQQAN